MKYLFGLLFINSLSTLSVYCQTWDITFDPPGDNVDFISIDTTINSNCFWEIGVPNKNVFSSSFSSPNSIVTSILNPVPANDTSIFYLSVPRDNINIIHNVELEFLFELNGDSTDYGKVEVSPDKGQTWVDLLTSDSSYEFQNFSSRKNLHSSSGWETFDVNIGKWASGIPPHPQITTDTFIFRFTYITDNNSILYDGWNIDNIKVIDLPFLFPIVVENQNVYHAHYPNPADTYIYFRSDNFECSSLKIFNSLGKIVYDNSGFVEGSINITDFPNGLYYLQYYFNHNYHKDLILIQH